MLVRKIQRNEFRNEDNIIILSIMDSFGTCKNCGRKMFYESNSVRSSATRNTAIFQPPTKMANLRDFFCVVLISDHGRDVCLEIFFGWLLFG